MDHLHRTEGGVLAKIIRPNGLQLNHGAGDAENYESSSTSSIGRDQPLSLSYIKVGVLVEHGLGPC